MQATRTESPHVWVMQLSGPVNSAPRTVPRWLECSSASKDSTFSASMSRVSFFIVPSQFRSSIWHAAQRRPLGRKSLQSPYLKIARDASQGTFSTENPSKILPNTATDAQKQQ